MAKAARGRKPVAKKAVARKAAVRAPRPKTDDLASLSLRDLNTLIGRATKIRDQMVSSARKAFINRTKAEAAELGLSLDDLVSVRASIPRAAPAKAAKLASKDKEAVAVKYRGPNGETWSGRGRKANWLTMLEAEGRKPDEFLV